MCLRICDRVMKIIQSLFYGSPEKYDIVVSWNFAVSVYITHLLLSKVKQAVGFANLPSTKHN